MIYFFLWCPYCVVFFGSFCKMHTKSFPNQCNFCQTKLNWYRICIQTNWYRYQISTQQTGLESDLLRSKFWTSTHVCQAPPIYFLGPISVWVAQFQNVASNYHIRYVDMLHLDNWLFFVYYYLHKKPTNYSTFN